MTHTINIRTFRPHSSFTSFDHFVHNTHSPITYVFIIYSQNTPDYKLIYLSSHKRLILSLEDEGIIPAQESYSRLIPSNFNRVSFSVGGTILDDDSV